MSGNVWGCKGEEDRHSPKYTVWSKDIFFYNSIRGIVRFWSLFSQPCPFLWKGNCILSSFSRKTSRGYRCSTSHTCQSAPGEEEKIAMQFAKRGRKKVARGSSQEFPISFFRETWWRRRRWKKNCKGASLPFSPLPPPPPPAWLLHQPPPPPRKGEEPDRRNSPIKKGGKHGIPLALSSGS